MLEAIAEKALIEAQFKAQCDAREAEYNAALRRLAILKDGWMVGKVDSDTFINRALECLDNALECVKFLAFRFNGETGYWHARCHDVAVAINEYKSRLARRALPRG